MGRKQCLPWQCEKIAAKLHKHAQQVRKHASNKKLPRAARRHLLRAANKFAKSMKAAARKCKIGCDKMTSAVMKMLN